MAALPPEVRPETGPRKELPPQFRRTLVDYYSKEPAGTVIVDTPNTYLYLVLGQGKALRYGIGVGREGFTWSGAEKVSRKAEWPDWNPPEQMIERQPYLPRFMAGGDGNRLARARFISVTPSIAFTAPISRPPSGPSSPRAASGSPTRTSRTCTPASRSARAWWCCRAWAGDRRDDRVGSSGGTASRDKPPGVPSSSDPSTKRLPAKRTAEPAQDAPKRSVEGEAGAVREPAPASKGHQDAAGFEE